MPNHAIPVTIRLFQPDEWPALRAIRIKKLQTEGQLFYRTAAEAQAQPDSYWRELATSNNEGAVWGLFDGAQLIGMTGIYVDEKMPEKAVLWGSWLEPAYRGQGLSDLIYKTRIAWAQAHPAVKYIVTSHRGTNEASKRSNQRHGFVYTHTKTRTWPDGAVEDEPFYELRLNKPV